jgi:hypothetical protein
MILLGNKNGLLNISVLMGWFKNINEKKGGIRRRRKNNIIGATM